MMEGYNPFNLEGKTIVITGASSGIGRECAISCSRMGAKVVLMGRNNERLTETLGQMARRDDHLVVPLDLSESQGVEMEIKRKGKSFGEISGVVHCAGISTTIPLRMMSEERLESFFRTNVHGAIHLTRLLVKPAMMPHGGSVLFMTSVMGVVGEAGKTLYGLTKGALIAGAKSLAIELAPRDIRVNCISPGVVVSPMSNSAVYSQDENSLEKIRSYHPLGFGSVEDVANASLFLLSNASRWITGTNLIVDGGYTAR